MVNIDSTAWKKTESELQTPHPGMFDIAQQQVFILMKFDGYARFLKSSVYAQKLLQGKQCANNEGGTSGGTSEGAGVKKEKSRWMGPGRFRIRSDTELASPKDALKRKKSLDSSLAMAVEDGGMDLDLNGLIPFDKISKQEEVNITMTYIHIS